ncbi:hypothetical protein PPERSA_07085 [Pseudocohnilembus persalinus]|uniref:Uncharacterized protein n=1 Tax=Pseudocohnilembus persalinus TaxID=266149 RepID=A0A0V0QXX8_PSEPJ|nr:hypothetical protein PPERSA_07085 [Pseudocohnilembus persalinus]|eukprot:KRX06922.1 hypothetical protein PPERSA_07085 [Pseudocohnilembus persalinus]
MSRFFKSASNYKYYSYLDKYNPNFVRKYQSGDHFFLGRRAAYKNLIYKWGGDSYGLEEEHNFKYKSHLLFTWLSYRLGWTLFVYFIIYNTFLLGDVGKAFNVGDWDHLVRPASDNDYPTRYESMYIVDKPQKW